MYPPMCRPPPQGARLAALDLDLEGLEGLKVPLVPPSRQSGSGTPLFLFSLG